jgi:chromatin modification-related protein VID21
MTTAQRTNGGIAQAQGVPQIRNQVNISQQQRTGTPSIGNARLSPQQFLQAQQQAQQLRAAQQAQQTQNQGQNNVNGNGPTNINNAHLATPRDIASSPAHVSPPHGPGVMSNAVNSPRPPSAQPHPLLQVQVPGNTASRPIGSYYPLAGMPEQLQNALRLQMQVSRMVGEHH